MKKNRERIQPPIVQKRVARRRFQRPLFWSAIGRFCLSLRCCVFLSHRIGVPVSLEDVTHIEQTSNPSFGRLVRQARIQREVGIRGARDKRLLIAARSGKRSYRHVRNNRGSSHCSLVAWILGLSRFQRCHSRAADNRHRDAPRTFLQG